MFYKRFKKVKRETFAYLLTISQKNKEKGGQNGRRIVHNETQVKLTQDKYADGEACRLKAKVALLVRD